MKTARRGKSHSLVLIGAMTLVLGCGPGNDGDDDDDDGGSGNAGATGGTSNAGSSSGATGGTTSGSGGSSAAGGTSGSGGSVMTTGGSAGTSGGKGGSSGSSGSSTLPTDFPTGFGPVEDVVTGLTRPVRIGFHDGYFYFTEAGADDGTHSRLGRLAPNGDEETLFTGSGVAAIYLDDNEIYFVERGTRSVFRMPYATLTPELFTTTELPAADIERIGERIYLTLFEMTDIAKTGVSAFDRATKEQTGNVLPVTSDTGFIFTYLSAGGGNLYLSTTPHRSTNGAPGLYRRNDTKAGVTVPNVFPTVSSTDANFVYFGDYTSGAIYRQAHSADMMPEVIATGFQPHAVEVTSDGIYWSNEAGCEVGEAGQGSIQAQPVGGGIPVTLATNEPCPSSITTDADYVYWTRTANYDGVGDDSIVRVRKMR